MKTQNKLFMLLLVLTFVISACGGAASTDAMVKPKDTMMEKPTEDVMAVPHDDMMAEDTMMEPTAEAMIDDTMSSGDGVMETPAWFSTSLIDVHTDEAFTINDLKGKVVLVETMAVWCSNCLKQQTQVKALHASLGERDDFVSIGFDIDPNEDVVRLKSFAEGNGFDWKYVVSPEDVSRDISSLYGAQFLNPPSTPMLIIDRHGIAHPLPFGIKSADDLMQALQPFLDEAI